MRGQRAGLLQQAMSEEAAAEQLLAAEAMFALHPTRESVKCARVEALIYCRAYGTALDACRGLQAESVDALYLTAEVHWRAGQLASAEEVLSKAMKLSGEQAGGKCAALGAFVVQLRVWRWHPQPPHSPSHSLPAHRLLTLTSRRRTSPPATSPRKMRPTRRWPSSRRSLR
jgi:hypothetical protein